MTHQFEFGATDELARRQNLLDEFLQVAFDDEDRPFFVSDEETLEGLAYDEELESAITERCRRHYGFHLDKAAFRLKLWQLLDELARRRIKPSAL